MDSEVNLMRYSDSSSQKNVDNDIKLMFGVHISGRKNDFSYKLENGNGALAGRRHRFRTT